MKTILGYSDKISVAPGETINFMVSSELDHAFTARIVRLIHGDLNPAGPGYREEAILSDVDGVYLGRRQLIHAGSYGLVAGNPVFDDLQSFTLQVMIWPTTPGRGEQVIASLWADGAGWELFIDKTGALSGRVGDGSGRVAGVSVSQPLLTRQWYLAALSLDAANGQLSLVQSPLNPTFRLKEAAAAVMTEIKSIGGMGRPLVFAGRAADAGAKRCTLHYNGKIDSPRLYAEALAGDRLRTLIPSETIVPGAPGLVGAWDFGADMEGVSFADVSGQGLVGELRQLPVRGVTGHNWRDTTRRWPENPSQYGAVHFHDDDIYDAEWEVSASWRTPEGLRSGLYALHVSTDGDEDYIPFAVRASKGGERAKILVLIPTASYLAYGNEHMAIDLAHAERAHDVLAVFNAADVFLAEHREYGNSLYDLHSDASPVCYSSRLRPLVNMRPKLQSWLGGMGSGLWQFNADTHILDWLEAHNFAYDCITDEDLHQGGFSTLAPYACVITGTHPEYISTEIWDSLEAYKEGGGSLMALGGNAFYWRIAYHKTLPGVLEVRREGYPAGETSHSFTGEQGGLWAGIGRSPHSMAGTGFIGQGFDISSYYRRQPGSYDPRAAFIFEGVTEEIIGDFGLTGGGAAGLELDRADYGQGTPAHALILASSENHTSIYMLSGSEMLINMPGLDATQSPQIHADLVFFETAAGGGVFSTGSIAWAGGLSCNGYHNTVSQITGNVLRRFISEERFV